MEFTLWCIVIGALLITMTIGSSFVAKLPLSAAMLYLAVGYAIGPAGIGLIDLHPLRDAPLLERLTEIAVVISLFTVGLKLELPLDDKRWRIPLQLATVSMMVTIAAVAVVGVYLLGLSPGAAVLLGAILAPTDPVLASDVQVANPGDRDRVRFGLTGEGGLNDGSAFPFVMLGLGLLTIHDLGDWGWRWWTVDVAWAIAGGLGIGYALGMLTGRTILYLRTRRLEALGADEFIAFGLIALAYGVAVLCATYGFLAVFAAGLALRRIDQRPLPHAPAPAAERSLAAAAAHTSEAAVRPAHAPAYMMLAVQRFNEQLERFAEVAIVLVLGALIPLVEFPSSAVWFIPLLFLVIRPVAVTFGLLGTSVTRTQRALISWFGIRGVGSLYYLMYAITHEIDPALATQLLSMTIAVVVASIILHGVSVTPLMARYERRKPATKRDGRVK